MLTRAIPKLPFIDKAATQKFYLEVLGFTLVSDYGDYFLLQREEAEMHFFSYPGLAPDRSDFMIYLRVDTGIDDLYRAFQQRGAVIHPNGPLETKPWGQREFAISDPNGTLLTFGEAVTGP